MAIYCRLLFPLVARASLDWCGAMNPPIHPTCRPFPRMLEEALKRLAKQALAQFFREVGEGGFRIRLNASGAGSRPPSGRRKGGSSQ